VTHFRPMLSQIPPHGKLAMPSLKGEQRGGVENRRSGFSLPVAVDGAFAASPQSGLAWLCFLFPLIEPNRRVSRIRLSEKVSRGRPRKAGRPCTKLDEPKLLMQSGFRIPVGRRPS